MSDPAVGAAKRSGNGWMTEGEVASDREALRPIRNVLDKLAADTKPPCNYATQIELFEKAINDISELVFTSEELKVGD